MHLEEFAEGHTAIHLLDPRMKFLCTLPLMALTATGGGFAGPIFGLLVAISLAVIARLDPGKLLIRLLGVNVFILMLWVFLPFSHPGRELFSIGPFEATHEGVLAALTITLKANAVVLMTISVFGTSEVFSLAHALVHLKTPKKLVYLFFFFYRYISVVHEEYVRLRVAMRVRCFTPTTGLHTYRTFASLAGVLLVRSFERSENMYKAMLCRGFHGHFPLMHHFHLHARDIAYAGVMTLSVAVFIALQVF